MESYKRTDKAVPCGVGNKQFYPHVIAVTEKLNDYDVKKKSGPRSSLLEQEALNKQGKKGPGMVVASWRHPCELILTSM